MAKRLNGVIKVGLGQSPSGKILERNTHFYHFTSRRDTDEKQANALLEVLKEHNETKRRMFYTHNNKAYVEVKEDWVRNKIQELLEQ